MKYFKLVFICFVISFVNSLVNGQCGPPPIWKNPEECCKSPSFLGKAIVNKCSKQVGIDTSKEVQSKGELVGPPGPEIARAMCFFDCAFNETGVLNNGVINDEKLRSVLTSAAIGDASLTSIINTGIDTCSSKMKTKASDLEKIFPITLPPGMEKCNPVAMFTSICVNAHVLKNCPYDKLVASADCSKLKEYVTKCPEGPAT